MRANWGSSTSTSLHSTLLEASSQHWNSHSPLLSSTAFHSFDLAMRVGKNPQFEIACWDCFNYINKMVYDAAADILKSMKSFIKYQSVTRFKYLLPISSKRGFEIWGSRKSWLASCYIFSPFEQIRMKSVMLWIFIQFCPRVSSVI